jgi:hypothetical protein
VEIPAAPEFTAMSHDFLLLVEQMQKNKIAPKAITLDDAAKAKSVFDGYIKLKAMRHGQSG